MADLRAGLHGEQRERAVCIEDLVGRVPMRFVVIDCCNQCGVRVGPFGDRDASLLHASGCPVLRRRRGGLRQSVAPLASLTVTPRSPRIGLNSLVGLEACNFSDFRGRFVQRNAQDAVFAPYIRAHHCRDRVRSRVRRPTTPRLPRSGRWGRLYPRDDAQRRSRRTSSKLALAMAETRPSKPAAVVTTGSAGSTTAQVTP